MSAAAQSYEDWKLARMCEGKTVWTTKARALREIARVRYEFGEQMEAYQCLNCMEWHTGHGNGEN